MSLAKLGEKDLSVKPCFLQVKRDAVENKGGFVVGYVNAGVCNAVICMFKVVQLISCS